MKSFYHRKPKANLPLFKTSARLGIFPALINCGCFVGPLIATLGSSSISISYLRNFESYFLISSIFVFIVFLFIDLRRRNALNFVGLNKFKRSIVLSLFIFIAVNMIIFGISQMILE